MFDYTYPRTDSLYLTEDMAERLPALVSSVAEALSFMADVPPVNTGQVVDSSKISVHYAIIPTPSMPKADLSSLPEGERNILHMLAVRLVCAVSDKYSYAETAVTLDCNGHSFAAKGKTVISDGWKTVESAFKASLKEKPTEGHDFKALPDMAEGQEFPAVSVAVKEGFTSPKKRYSEESLLAVMESAGAEDMPDMRNGKDWARRPPALASLKSW